MSQSMYDIGQAIHSNLLNKVNINKPLLIHEGASINYGKSKQFHIIYENEFYLNLIQDLSNKIIENAINGSVTFGELILPNKVVFTGNYQHNNLLFRYLELYDIKTDNVEKRIDVLVIIP